MKSLLFKALLLLRLSLALLPASVVTTALPVVTTSVAVSVSAVSNPVQAQPIRATVGILEATAANYDSDAQAFFTATGITDNTQKAAINQLVLDLKSYGIWAKCYAIYPMVGGTATTHKYNLKDPRDLDAAYRLNFVGSWTHSSTGATASGTYANTFLTPSTALGQNDKHMSFYSRSSGQTGCVIGCNDDVLFPSYSGSNDGYFGLSYTGFTTWTSTSTGFHLVSRPSSTNQYYYRNGGSKVTGTVTSNTNPNVPIFIGAKNSAGSPQFYSASECAFASIGPSLSDTEAANFSTAVTTYETALSR